MKDDKSHIEREVTHAVDVLRRGGTILYPTDTVWGIGCDPANPNAVRRIFQIKHRTDSKALILLAGSLAQIEAVTGRVTDGIINLLRSSERPLTIIYPCADNITKEVTAYDGSVAMRLSNEEFSRKLCLTFGNAIISTSANISGEPSPSNFSEIAQEIIESVDHIVDFRREDSTHGARPSKIIKIDPSGNINVIRE